MSMAGPSLSPAAAQCIVHSLAPGSQSGYLTKFLRCVGWCRTAGVAAPVPFTDAKVVAIMDTVFAEGRVHGDSFQSYVASWIFVSNLVSGLESNVSFSPFLRRLLQGFGNLTAPAFRRLRHAIRAQELFSLSIHVAANQTSGLLRAFAMAAIGTSCLLRASSIMTLATTDLRLICSRNNEAVSIAVTVRFRKGQSVLSQPLSMLMSTPKESIPNSPNWVDLVWRFVRSRPAGSFLFSDGAPAAEPASANRSRAAVRVAPAGAAGVVTSAVRALYSDASLSFAEAGLTSHLYRRGGASMAAAIGVDLDKLAVRGGWASAKTMRPYLLLDTPNDVYARHFFGALLPGGVLEFAG